MIRTASILPLCAGFVGLALAILTLSVRRVAQLTRGQLLFTMLCASSGSWALSVAAHANVSTVLYPTLSGDTPTHHALEVILTTCVMASSVFWFLFAASHTGREELTRGPALLAALLPIAYTTFAASTNPSHGLFFSLDARTGVRTFAPLSFPHVFMALAFLVAGTAMFVLHARTAEDPEERRGASLVAIAGSAVLVGNLLWLTRSVTGLGLSMNPAPSLLVLVEMVLASRALRHGMADILPGPESVALSEARDGVIHVGEDSRVVSSNRTASDLLPELRAGARMEGINQAIARHIRYCLDYGANDLTFEVDHNGRTCWGRIRRIPEDGDAEGCVIILTDLTELRALQGDLIRLGQPLDGRTPTGDYFDRLARQAGGRLS